MSVREMFLKDMDYMSEDFLYRVLIEWREQETLEIPNEETIEAMEDVLNGRTHHYTTFEDMLKKARELDDDEVS